MNLTKEERYHRLLRRLEGLLDGEAPVLTNLSNAAALLYQELKEVSWLGFYLVRGGELFLGPFQGRPACIRIPFGKGVCGTACAQRKTQVVPDVGAFAGHIACDSRSRAEIVVPLLLEGEAVGVLDIDSMRAGRFDEADRVWLEKAARLLTGLGGWNQFKLL